MTFTLRGRTLPIVVYGQFRTLINLLLVLALGGIFIWGSFRVFGALAGSSSAAPVIATATPVVERPTAPPAPTATRRANTGPGSSVKGTPTPRPTPRPSPTPKTAPKVIVVLAESDTKGETKFSAAAIPFAGGFPILWFRVRNSALPQTGSITFSWYREQPTVFINQYAAPRSVGEFTDVNYRDSQLHVPGAKFRCDVAVNGVPIDSVHFTITP